MIILTIRYIICFLPLSSGNLLPRIRQSFIRGRAVFTKHQTIRNSINLLLLHSRDLWIQRAEKKNSIHYLTVYFFFSFLQRTSVVSSSVEWQNGRAIQKQSGYDRAQWAHHKEGEILAELRTGPERWDIHIVCVIFEFPILICSAFTLKRNDPHKSSCLNIFALMS